jgi:hypothetical protein
MDDKLKGFCEFLVEAKDDYILIGGNACRVQFEKNGAQFRATKDIDAVLVLGEEVSPVLTDLLWRYLKQHEYKGKKFVDGAHVGGHSYRFTVTAEKSNENGCPKEIELFCREPDAVELNDGQHIVPIETEEPLSDLSAILMDDVLYDHLLQSTEDFDGLLRLATVECLIVLKAKAWLGNRELLEQGSVREENVHKHAVDICRLLEIVNDEFFVPEALFNTVIEVAELFEQEEERQKLAKFSKLDELAISPLEAAPLLRNLVKVSAP